MEDKGYISGTIVYNKKIASNIYKMRIEGRFDGKPGQFYMLRAWGDYPYLSRPISIYDVSNDYIEFLYAVVGLGTEIMAEKKEGDSINLLGPLGNGFDLNKKYDKVAIVSGGIGIAPLLFLAKNIDANSIDLLAGFKNEVYCVEDFQKYCNIKIATEDGSAGTKGFVTEIIDDSYDAVFVCGPMPMMKATADKIKSEEKYVSLEANMGCGIGGCLGCQVKVKDGRVLRICTEGPVFGAEEVFYNA